MLSIRANPTFGGEDHAITRNFEGSRGGNGGGRSCICWGRGAGICEENGESDDAVIVRVEEVVGICFTTWDWSA